MVNKMTVTKCKLMVTVSALIATKCMSIVTINKMTLTKCKLMVTLNSLAVTKCMSIVTVNALIVTKLIVWSRSIH